MIITDSFLLSNTRVVSSPNYDFRPAGSGVSLLVIHCMSLPAGEFGTPYIEELFLNTLDEGAHSSFASLKNLKVSSHLVIRRTGVITQYVPFNLRSWHAGTSIYEGRQNCNDYSIGIELEGTSTTEFEDSQYESLSKVSQLIMGRFPEITLSRIVGHQEVARGRKSDPGIEFDWSRYLGEVAKIERF